MDKICEYVEALSIRKEVKSMTFKWIVTQSIGQKLCKIAQEKQSQDGHYKALTSDRHFVGRTEILCTRKEAEKLDQFSGVMG